MNRVSFVVASFALLVGFVACSKSSADKDAPVGASAAQAAAKSGGSSAKAAPAAADPAADLAQIAASCDTVENLGECAEYKELGLMGDAIKGLCEGLNGKYSTSARCPKDGRMSVCSTEVKRTYYYKAAFDMTTAADQEKFCKETLAGTYVDLAKTAAAAKPSK
jgi:hypothetical protein